jgi:primosomal protein N' (replication factor Y)
VQPGCRLLVPFGAKKLAGVVVRCHDEPPKKPPRQALRLLDEEPALSEELMSLGQWIAAYYCAPLGEVFRIMAPLRWEVHPSTVYSLTDAGRDAARQLVLSPISTDPAAQLLYMLEARPLSESYLKKKLEQADKLLNSLERKGLIRREEVHLVRDPLRAPASKLRVRLSGKQPLGKLSRAERELLAYLELHPGAHNVGELERIVRGASRAGRLLARKKIVLLDPEPPGVTFTYPAPRHALNVYQQMAFDRIRKTIEAKRFHTFLLFGVTGSGKTEVYLRAIEATLAQGRGVLLLVPEIALTPAVAGQFYHRFGDRVAILHSAFTDRERTEQWRRIRTGAAPVVVGTRSGVFAPVPNLGLIVVDEEHDQSYKQEETPRYHGRDVAIVRAKALGACVVLGSATPSLESRYNAERGKYTLLELPERIERRALPDVRLIDMRVEFLETRKQSLFSRALVGAIDERLTNNEQVMLLLNRRGFSSFMACRKCGERLQCVNCAVTLTFHRRDQRMLCHYCNYATRVPKVCPKCGSEHIYFLGAGSERVEEELRRNFPRARIARMDRDTITGKREYETILNDFRAGHYDILVGTQMIAKGHDIPNVTLVGVVNADVALGLPDFRASERVFQLLTQVAGRAGRGETPGVVLVQTINPDHYAIRFAAAQDYNLFYQKEIQYRRVLRYPPFSAMANLLIRSKMQEEAARMSAELERILTPPPDGAKILGPAEAPVPRLREEYRYQLVVKSPSRKILGEIVHKARQFAMDAGWNSTALVIDVDPLTLM